MIVVCPLYLHLYVYLSDKNQTDIIVAVNLLNVDNIHFEQMVPTDFRLDKVDFSDSEAYSFGFVCTAKNFITIVILVLFIFLG